MDWQDRIVKTPEVLGGKPRINGTRMAVVLICEFLDAGSSVADILNSYPFLTADDIDACRRYAAAYGTVHDGKVTIDDDGIHLPGKTLPWQEVISNHAEQ